MENNPTSKSIEVVRFRISHAVDYRLHITTFCDSLTVKSIERRFASVAAVLPPHQMQKYIKLPRFELAEFVFS
jgi:hypothetical protein